QRFAWLTVVTKGIECGRRNGIDRVGPDHLLNIKNVGISRIFRAGTGPKHALCLSAYRAELVPLRAGEDIQIALVSKFAVRNGDFAWQTLELLFFLLLLRGFQSRR